MARPNILVITTDQQRTDSLSCYGSEFTHTPNLDRLASGGVILDRAYCCNPVCTPSRVSIFSGLQVSRHGVWNVGVPTPDEIPLLSHRLCEQGYRTHYTGKMHFRPFSAPGSIENWRTTPFDTSFTGPYYGFETVELASGHTHSGFGGHYGAWVREQLGVDLVKEFGRTDLGRLASTIWGGQGYNWNLPVAFHNSVWTVDRAIHFLRNADNDRPFFLALWFQDPHHLHCVSSDFEDRVKTDQLPLPDYDEGELDDKPPHFLAQREGRIVNSGQLGTWSLPAREDNRPFHLSGQGRNGYLEVEEEDGQVGKACYYSMVKLIDREMGRLLNCLESEGLSDNTLLIFTTDYGELLGDHGLWLKGPFHYEQLVRVPTIVRWPAGFQGGMRCSELFSHVDIAPTVLDAAGIEARDLDGISALPMFRGDSDRIRDDVLIECVDAVDGLRLKTLVTQDEKLTWYADWDFGEFYDLGSDPREKVNLWESQAHHLARSRLLGRILERMSSLESLGSRSRGERIALA